MINRLICLPLVLCCLSTRAQVKAAPSLLRVDLLQYPERVYDHGARTGVSLEQAVRSGGEFEFCRVNSRFPAFSWAVPGGYQSACQILVASQKKLLLHDSADVWNSGKEKSKNNTGVIYGGSALQSSTIYYWKVRTWGSDGKAGPYSPIQVFCTGEKPENFALPSFVLVKTEQQSLPSHSPDTNSIQYDFGKDGFGHIKVLVTASDPGDTLIIHLGEALSADGRINRTPPGSVRYRMIKVPLQEGQRWYEPILQPDKRNRAKNAILMPAEIGEVLPFRYAEMVRASGRYTVDSVSRSLVTSVFDDDATRFTSSDTVLNKIWDFCKYTIKATSFSGYYVDGDRERLPYEADALITQLSHYACDAEYTMAERTLYYLIYHPTWPTEWSLQNILLAWNDYLYSGDPRLIRKIYPDLQAKLLSGLAREDGLISTHTGKQTPDFLKSIHYSVSPGNTGLKDIVDWPQSSVAGQPSSIMGETDGFVFADYNAVVNAYYYAGLQMMSRLAMAVGKFADARYYRQEAVRVRTAFQHAFFDEQTGLVLDGEGTRHSSLHANFFALEFGLLPKDKIAAIVSFIHSRGMACSVYGAQFLLDGLCEANDADYAQALVTSAGERSWLNMIREGASMTMEAWGQEYKPNEDWNHAWGAAPANYIVRQLAGIQPIRPGYEEVQIKPHPGSVEHAELKYKTIRGDIDVSFENLKDRFSLRVTLPGNTTGLVYLPSRSEKAIIRMDGRVVKAVYEDGYALVEGVKAGKHYFEAADTPQ